MSSHRNSRRRRAAGRLFIGAIAGAGAMSGAVLTAGTAGAAGSVSAFFGLGVLTVIGDAQDNSIVISRDAAGTILVNGGGVRVFGGTPTVANTRSISVIGGAGRDVITLDEAGGALPRANLFGGAHDDTLTGGAGADTMIGQGGNDVLFGKGGQDSMFGSAGNDTLTGGDADDRAFGDAGDDRMIWNPGDDTDLNEGGADVDTTEVIGGNGAEAFSATANGARVRFDRLDPAPFAIDIGTTENLVLNANGGNDSFSATGDLAALIKITVDGGGDDDTILGGNGIDVLLGGAGNDFVDGQQGNDVALLGAGDDVFQWDPGDGSDTIEGQDNVDTMLFNGSNGDENFDVSANGSRVRFFRNLGNITMDTDDVERIQLNALGGADTFVVNDMSGTDLVEIATDLAAVAGTGTGDNLPDSITVLGSNGDDIAVLAGDGAELRVVGLPAELSFTGFEPANDRLTVSTLDGDDVVDASGVAAGSMPLTLEMGAGDDVAIGGAGDDTITGAEGDDVLIGGDGVDTLDGGPGDDVLIDGEIVIDGLAAGEEWLAAHARTVNGKTVIDYADQSVTLPAADL